MVLGLVRLPLMSQGGGGVWWEWAGGRCQWPGTSAAVCVRQHSDKGRGSGTAEDIDF